MGNTTVRRAVVVATNPPVLDHQGISELALYNPDGSRAGTVNKQANQVDTTAADLAALKVDFNALLAKLRAAGVLTAP